MNLGQARARLSSRGFQYLSNDVAALNAMLNAGKDALEDEYPWPWLETTATTQAAPITLTDLKYVLYVVDLTNRNELEGIDARDVIDRDPDVTTTGPPECWWLDGTQTLRTYPVSTTALLSVRYVRTSPDLANDSDTPLIPSRYHPVWVDYAAVEAYKDQPNFNAANAVLADVRQRRLPAMIETYVTRNRQNPDQQVVTLTAEDW